jgi:hypothetical protein
MKALNMQRKKRLRKKPFPSLKTNSSQTLKMKEKVMHLTHVVIVRINDYLLKEHKSQTSNIANLVEKKPVTKQKKTIIREKNQVKNKLL